MIFDSFTINALYVTIFSPKKKKTPVLGPEQNYALNFHAYSI